MTTDWALVRHLMNSALDACEASERLQLREDDRALPTGTNGVVVWEVLTSAWTYPENVQYHVIHARHRLNNDARYRPELARVLREVAVLCGELVGASRLDEPASGAGSGSIRDMVMRLAAWYPEQMVAQLTRAAANRTEPSGS